MNMWLLAVILLQAAIIVCGLVAIRGKLFESIVAMEMASGVTVLSVAMLAVGMGRPAWFDLALALALLSFPGAMVFLIFLERWL